jgi:hypothetical protein
MGSGAGPQFAGGIGKTFRVIQAAPAGSEININIKGSRG